MDIKILDSILHGDLKPWKLADNSSKRFGELIKAAKVVDTSTNASLAMQLSTLLADCPKLLLIITQASNNTDHLRNLSWNTELPKYIDIATQFYYLVITSETVRLYNAILQQAASWTNLIDIRYQVGKALTSVKVLAQQTSEEMQERQYQAVPDNQSNTIHFTLYYLKLSLLSLYFSIQEEFKESLQQFITQEDFCMIELQEPLGKMVTLNHTKPELVTDPKRIAPAENFTFGFKGNTENLKTVINQLCFQIDLINQDASTIDELLKLLTAKSFSPGAVQIRLGCETKVFRYVIDKLRPAFKELTLANIERSKAFLSKQEGNPITANNLSVSGSKSAVEPKDKTTIDKIIKQLQ